MELRDKVCKSTQYFVCCTARMRNGKKNCAQDDYNDS